MARIRSLKPSFFKNEDLARLSFAHRICYEGLWCYADRDGRLEDRPARLKAEIFPYDNIDMEKLLSDLCAAGFIQRYSSGTATEQQRHSSGTAARPRRDSGGTVAVIWIPTFDKHQVPKQDERPSVLPAYTSSDSGGPDAVPPPDSGGTVAVPRVGSREVGSREVGNREVGSGEVGGNLTVADATPPRDGPAALQQLWNEITTKPIPRCTTLTKTRRQHALGRLKERPLDEWRAVFERIEASQFCRGENDRGWVASFEWIVGGADPAVKVLEGKYDDRARSRPSQFDENEMTHLSNDTLHGLGFAVKRNK